MGPSSDPPSPKRQPSLHSSSVPSPVPTPKLSLDSLLAPDSSSLTSLTHRRTSAHTPKPSEQDGSATETIQPVAVSHSSHHKRDSFKRFDRSLTLPSSSRPLLTDALITMSPPRLHRPLSRRPSSSASSSSSTSSSPSPIRSTHLPSSSTMGRKVAASLDLFKETATTPSADEPDSFNFIRPLSSSSKRKGTTAHVHDVAQAQFEFVKRSDWPDREAAAIRRERSTTALERVRTRESITSTSSVRETDSRRRKDRQSSVRDSVLSDLVQWREAVASEQNANRGRQRERSLWSEDLPLQVGSLDSDSSTSSNSTLHDRPPSPCLSLTRTDIPPPSPQLTPDLSLTATDPSDIPEIARPIFLHSSDYDTPPPARLDSSQFTRSTTPTQTRSSYPHRSASLFPTSIIPDISLSSPWSTDDESSAWETASVSTTTSTTSASSPFPLSPSRTSPLPQPIVRQPSDEHQRGMLSPYNDEEGINANDIPEVPDIDGLATNLGFNLSQESLPHIPLRPFRNQVGGHSAIYKFTKRAVCKVSYMLRYKRP